MAEFQSDIVARAIDYLAVHHGEQPDLDALAARFGYESTHFQKLFRDYVGISPKRLIQFMSYSRARDLLLEGFPTLDAAYQVGLSGGGRLHDLFVACEAATPGMVQKRGQGMEITYGFHPSPLGELLIGKTIAGVCWAGFVVEENRAESVSRMLKHWPKAHFIESDAKVKREAEHVLRIWRGEGDGNGRLKLDLHGTNFQIQVWRALLKIPAGGTVSYQHIADALGVPKACRAVGTAVGANPIALLIPCHRVIQKSGIVENYAWGTARKKIILSIESSRYARNLEVLADC